MEREPYKLKTSGISISEFLSADRKLHEDKLIKDFVLCNSHNFRQRKLFLKLKSWFLQKHIETDGYDLNYWYDYDWYNREEHHAVHKHILTRYIINNELFHLPEGAFYYKNHETGRVNKSGDFDLKESKAKHHIFGKKILIHEIVPGTCFESLKRLIGYYRYTFPELKYSYAVKGEYEINFHDNTFSKDSSEGCL